MNVNFGDDNFYVRYLKRFLNQELGLSSTVLGNFDRNDLDQLVQYLNLPNVKNMFEVQADIKNEFDRLEDLFVVHLEDEVITYTAKQISSETAEWLSDNLDNIKSFCESCGWELTDSEEWIDTRKDINGDGVIDTRDRDIMVDIVLRNTQYPADVMDRADIDRDGLVTQDDIDAWNAYYEEGNPYFIISKNNRKNYFPNEDMLVFVNQFKGLFMKGYAIRDKVGIDDMPHVNAAGDKKIALFKCKPGQKLTIAHNSKKTVHMVIGSSPAYRRSDLKSFRLGNVVEVDLKPGEGYEYTTSSYKAGTGGNARWLCIQLPSSYDNLDGNRKGIITLEAGDINFDGRIDMLDYKLLADYTAMGPGADELHWNPTKKQLAVMNVYTENEKAGTVNNKDAVYLWRFLQGDPRVPSLGVTYYEYDTDGETEVENVSDLLIIEGHYDKKVNIPFDDFRLNPWIVHDKFFNYLFGMAIHKYSDSENISYLQKLLKAIYPEHMYDKHYFYPGVFNQEMKDLILEWQYHKVRYTTGDLNRDNKLSREDLVQLRNYLTDLEDINIMKQIVNHEIEPTSEQIAKYDYNHDGRVTQYDLNYFTEVVDKDYSKLFITRADVNKDGLWNEDDYRMLESAVLYLDVLEGKMTLDKFKETYGLEYVQSAMKALDDLTSYDITFMLGWYDVETEAMIESEVNTDMSISEVSK